jgi:hypothetical protein
MANKDILTPAQRRIINEAQLRPDHAVRLFGIPYTTKDRLKELGIIETVSTLTGDEAKEMRKKIKAYAGELLSVAETADLHKLADISAEIQNCTWRLQTTKTVLTAAGLAV